MAAYAIGLYNITAMERARAWYHDPEYAPLIMLRQGGSQLTFLLVEGSD